MKKSKKITILALTLALSAFASCSTASAVSLQPYWLEKTNQAEENVSQTLVYDVTYKKDVSILDKRFSLAYENGTYTTRLSMENMKIDDKDTLVYKYTTSLQIDVTYTFDKETASFTDSVETISYFHTTKKNLAPISSEKTIKGTYPIGSASDPTSVKDYYREMHTTIKTSYGSENSCTMINYEDEKELSSSTQKFKSLDGYAYLDNEQLLFALSGVSPNNTPTPQFSVYAPFSNAVQVIGVTFNEVKTDKFTNRTINGNTGDYTINYYPVDIKISNNSNASATQKAFYASRSKSPEFRNVMIQLETPISYNLGYLVYSLKSAEFSK